MLRYVFDEHVAEAIGEQLKLRGVDVLTAKGAGRANQKIADVDHLAFAVDSGTLLWQHAGRLCYNAAWSAVTRTSPTLTSAV